MRLQRFSAILGLWCILGFWTVFRTQAQTITTNFSSLSGSVPTQFYGLNIWDGTNPAVQNDATYQQRIGALALPIVRYHAYETYVQGNPKSWIDFTNQTWNKPAILNALSALDGRVGGRVISIFNFPIWLSSNNKKLPYSEASINAYADWCASLVQIINKESPYYARYWEIFNELEDSYVGKTDSLAVIYNRAAERMKAVDPTIKIGGMSLTQPYWSPTDQEVFYGATKANLDYVAYHNYGGASTDGVDNQVLYNAARTLATGGCTTIRSRLNGAGVSANVLIWLGETNMVWTWTGDQVQGKQAKAPGAVFDALVFSHALKAGCLQSVQLFNERDGIYGKLSATNQPRPAYHVLQQFSTRFTGQPAQVTQTLSETNVVAVATRQGTTRNVAITNRSAQPQPLTLVMQGLTAGTKSLSVITVNNALSNTTITTSTGQVSLTIAPETVVFVLLDEPAPLAVGGSVWFNYPYSGQSILVGSTVPVRLNVTPPNGLTVSQATLYHQQSGSLTRTVVGATSAPPYTIPWTPNADPATTRSELTALVTFSDGSTLATGTIPVDVLPASGPCSNRSFYVRAGATGPMSGTLASEPFDTFQKVMQLGRPLPGDVIHVMSNTATFAPAYATGPVLEVIRTGRVGCPITVRNYDQTRPKLRFSGWSGISVPPGMAYINVRGLEVEGNNASVTLPQALTQPGSCANPGGSPDPRFNGNGISIDGRNAGGLNPHHITLTDNLVHDCGGAGISAIEADYISVERNVVYNNSWYTIYGTSGISLFHPWNFDQSTTGYRNVVRQNVCYNNRLFVPWVGMCQITDGNGIILDDFRNSQASSTIRGQVYTGRTLVANNLVYNNGGSGIHAYESDRIDILHNTAYQNSQSSETTGEIFALDAGDVRIVNNIMRPISGEKAFVWEGSNTNVSHTNNLYVVSSTTQVVASGQNVMAAPSTETAIWVSPSTDPATANFGLKGGSSAIDIGTNAFTAVVGTDFLGNTRPVGALVDAGAYEGVSCTTLFTLKAGDWTDPTVWSCNRLPLSTDVVYVRHAVAVPAGTVAQALRIVFEQ